MSFQSAIAGLPAPVKDLVLKATQDGTNATLLGETEADQKTVNEWVEKSSKGDLWAADGLKGLNEILTPKTYLATNYLSAADVALYGVLHPAVAALKGAELFTHPSVTRYFDHIQSRPVVRSSADALQTFPAIPIDLANAPPVERKAEAPKKKEKAPKADAAAPAPATATAKGKGKEQAPAATEQGQQKKEKKEKIKKEGQEEGTSKKQKQKAPAAPAAPAADDGPPVPSMIDLRVGHIVDVQKHPDADGLYIEQVDLGEETGPRTVVSGLVNYIPIENMRDQDIVVVCNLKPANMRGVKSHAMVLCATSKDGKDAGIELVQPPAGSKPGERVYFEGEYEAGVALPQLNPKKKIFEAIQPGFITLDSKEAAWVNPETKSVHKIRTKDGVCVAPTLVGASLS